MRIRRFNGMEGVYLLTPQVLSDTRGRVMPAYDFDQLQESCGLDSPFIHAELYYLIARGLVGLYYQEVNPRASLYRCVYGRAQIVAVDLRQGSLTFGKFQQAIIDSTECMGFFTKPGFATGCVGVNGPASIYVEHSTRNALEEQKVLKWDDPSVGITWAGLTGTPFLGTRERMGVSLGEIKPYGVE